MRTDFSSNITDTRFPIFSEKNFFYFRFSSGKGVDFEKKKKRKTLTAQNIKVKLWQAWKKKL